jgi:hypothetical protein
MGPGKERYSLSVKFRQEFTSDYDIVPFWNWGGEIFRKECRSGWNLLPKFNFH